MLPLILGCTVSGLAVSAILTALIRRLAPRWGLVDRPGVRKVHTEPTPLGGGLAIACGVLIPLVAAQAFVWMALNGFLPAGVLPTGLTEHLAGISSRTGEL